MVDAAGVFRLTGHNRTSHNLATVRRTCGRLRWHVVATGADERQFRAETALATAGWRVLNPLHVHRIAKRADRITPLWPGYLLVGWRDGVDWTAICRMRWVWQVLMSAPGKPAVLPDGTAEAIQARMSPRRVVDDPWVRLPVYRPGQRLVVANGPLAGLDGICRLTAGERVHLLMSLLGRDVDMELHPLDVVPDEA